MKIKTTKTMNLPQLIEYIWDNKIKNERFRRLNRCRFEYVWVNENSNIGFDDDILCRKNDVFEIEVEEDITEDTVIPKIVSIGKKNENEINIHHYCRISQFIDNKDFNYYVLNDDDTLTLIWCDGKLIKE